MDLGLLLTLGGLALVDSTSFGTLLVPLWLMTVSGRLRPGRVLAFLAVVAGCYLVMGTALLLGGRALLDAAGDQALDSTPVLWVQLALGVALFAASFRFGGDRGGDRGGAGSGRLVRWRDRAVAADGSARGVVALALVAATLEVATMLPYLGAIGLLAGSGAGRAAQLGVLAAYCVVMTLPALVLLGLRVALRERVEPLLARVSGWLERTGAEATAWVLGIAGFLVGGGAAQQLFL